MVDDVKTLLWNKRAPTTAMRHRRCRQICDQWGAYQPEILPVPSTINTVMNAVCSSTALSSARLHVILDHVGSNNSSSHLAQDQLMF